MTAGYPAIIADAEVWEAEPTSDLASHPVLYVRDDHLLVDDVAVSPDAQRPGMGTVCSTSPTNEHEQPPARGAAPHQRSDDGDPRLLPAARLPRELPGPPETASDAYSLPNPEHHPIRPQSEPQRERRGSGGTSLVDGTVYHR